MVCRKTGSVTCAGDRPAYGTHFACVSGLNIGYARVSTETQYLTAGTTRCVRHRMTASASAFR
jgi:hypothetical protein